MEEDDYYLKWEKHHNAFVSVFDYLYKQNILVDCTLAAEDKFIKAHRIILMACSPYLQNLLCEHSDNYPIVFFDIKYSELEAIVNFCYHGEVKVPYNELEGFIEAATMLQIKGLCRSSESDGGSDKSEKNKRRLSLNDSNKMGSACKKKRRISNNNDADNGLSPKECLEENTGDGAKSDSNGYTENNPLAMVSVKSEPEDMLNLAGEMQGGSDNSDVDSDDTGASSGPEGEDIDHIKDFINSSSTILFPWTCNRCGEAFATRAPYEEHRRNCSRSDPVNHPWKCHKCPNAYKNKKDLVRHLIYCGNDTPRLYCNRCGSSYKYERGLRRHQKYCGTDVKPLKCPQCEKTYKYKRGLRRHQRRCGIAEALQFLAGKGVTPVVVTKRSLGMPRLGDLSRSSLSMFSSTPQLSQLTQLSTLEKSVLNKSTAENSDPNAQTESMLGINSLSEASVCLCGKIYKYKKSYDKHIASCACGSLQQNAESGRKSSEKQSNDDDQEDAQDEDEDENNEENQLNIKIVEGAGNEVDDGNDADEEIDNAEEDIEELDEDELDEESVDKTDEKKKKKELRVTATPKKVYEKENEEEDDDDDDDEEEDIEKVRDSKKEEIEDRSPTKEG